MRFREDLWNKLKNEGFIINPPELEEGNSTSNFNNTNQGLILKNTFSMCIPKNKSVSPQKKIPQGASSMSKNSPRYKKELKSIEEEVKNLREANQELKVLLQKNGIEQYSR